MKKKNIIVGITGSIAAYKSCDLVNSLVKNGYEVTCVMTKEAEKFITPLTLETLSGNKVYTDMFCLPDKRKIAHISLAEKADAILVSPASANIIAKIAAGICDDLLTCVIISSVKPVLIAPAMNEKMYNNSITQRNVKELEKAGYKIIEPVKGRLACGHIGVGHLAELKQIVEAVGKILK